MSYHNPHCPPDITPQWLTALRNRISANDLEAVTQIQGFLSAVRDIGSVHYLLSALPIAPWPPAAIGSANATHAFNLVPGIVYYMLKVVADSHKNIHHRPAQYFNPRQPISGGWNGVAPPWYGMLAGDHAPSWMNNQPQGNSSWNPAFSQHEQNQSNQIQQLQLHMEFVAARLNDVMQILQSAGLVPPSTDTDSQNNNPEQPSPNGSGE